MENEQMTITEDKTILGIILAVVGSSLFSVIVTFIFTFLISFIIQFGSNYTVEELTNKVNDFYARYDIEYFITITSMLLLLFVYCLIIGKTRIKKILSGFTRKKTWTWFALLGIGFVVVSYLYSYLTSLITSGVDNANQSEVIKLIEGNYYLSFVYVVLLAPIIEEIGMRYFVFGSIKQKNKLVAYILGSSIFALLHFMVLIGSKDINVLSELLAIPTYLGAGLLLCFAYDKTENLACPIAIHIFNNLISYLLILL